MTRHSVNIVRGKGRGQRSGWFRRAVANLTIMAVFGLLFMPLAGTMGNGEGWTTVEICSVNGPQTVVLDEKGNPVQGKTASHQHVCPFCSAHAGYTLPPPASLVLPGPTVLAEQDRAWAGGVIVPEQLFLVGHSPRDPPSA